LAVSLFFCSALQSIFLYSFPDSFLNPSLKVVRRDFHLRSSFATFHNLFLEPVFVQVTVRPHLSSSLSLLPTHNPLLLGPSLPRHIARLFTESLLMALCVRTVKRYEQPMPELQDPRAPTPSTRPSGA